MYATNAVASVHSSFRKVTKQGTCPNEKNLHTFLDIPDNPLFLLTQVRTNYATRHQNETIKNFDVGEDNRDILDKPNEWVDADVNIVDEDTGEVKE